MELLLMRHGSAQESRNDFSRRLTAHGMEEVHLAAKSISRHEFVPDILFASPLTRAQQTAEIVSSHLVISAVECDRIVPAGDCKQVCDFLDGCEAKKVLLVSHQPFVSLFIQYLTGEQIFMNTASLSMIRVETLCPGGGALLWTE
ncbi:MAG: phosphohistidine phosphatase [Candidatus Azotimanducaceae bacterium]|jgi:phosphohistidine phosphatase